MTPLPELDAVPAAPPAMPAHTLAIGTRLREYEIKGLIGEGTCSIVYLAWDHALHRKVAVKEYMPAAMVGRMQGSANVVVAADRHLEAVRAGLKSFINEARLLARFDHPSLLKVYRSWEENGTAYMVMPYYEGPTLKTALTELDHVPSESELRAWLKPILNALTLLHDGAVWHQNIGPDEILLTPFGPVLLGFAAAAHAIEAINHTPAAALKAGFAAIEQYGSEAATTRGPWTDLYALAAVVYAAITGGEPEPAADRLAHDRLRPLAIVAAGLYSARFLTAIDAAMAVQPKLRPADHAEFRALMGDIDAPEALSLAPRSDLMQEPFAGAAAGAREVTVPDRPLLAVGESAQVTGAAVASAPRVDARVPAAAKPPGRSTLDASKDGTPSWMKTPRASALLSKRALYSVVAATFALIGIAALVVQFANRGAGRAAPAAVATTTATRAPASAGPATPSRPSATVTANATTPAASAANRIHTTQTRAIANAAPPSAQPVPAPVAAPSRTPAGATAATTLPATTVAARSPAPVPVPAPAPIVATSPEQRQSRCTEILQKASLEKITAAETDFFKRECK